MRYLESWALRYTYPMIEQNLLNFSPSIKALHDEALLKWTEYVEVDSTNIRSRKNLDKSSETFLETLTVELGEDLLAPLASGFPI